MPAVRWKNAAIGALVMMLVAVTLSTCIGGRSSELERLRTELAEAQAEVAQLKERIAALGGSYLGVMVESHDFVKIVRMYSNDPAARAGVKDGSIITRIGDFEIDNCTDLEKALWHYMPGERVMVWFLYGANWPGNRMAVEVYLGSAPRWSALRGYTPGELWY